MIRLSHHYLSAQPGEYDAIWHHTTSILSTVPPNLLTHLQLGLIAPVPQLNQFADPNHVSNDSWTPFVTSLQRFEKLALVEVAVAVSVSPNQATAELDHNPVVAKFFKSSLDHLFPEDRNYRAQVNFMQELSSSFDGLALASYRDWS